MSEEPDHIVNSGCSFEDNKSSQDSLYVHGSPSSESLDPEFAMNPTFSIEELGSQASAEDAEDDNLQRSSVTFEFQGQGVLLPTQDSCLGQEKIDASGVHSEQPQCPQSPAQVHLSPKEMNTEEVEMGTQCEISTQCEEMELEGPPSEHPLESEGDPQPVQQADGPYFHGTPRAVLRIEKEVSACGDSPSRVIEI